MKHLNIQIYGLVQGIFFRVSAKEKADQLNITGFAKNLPDGSVYIEAEGKEKNLDEFLKWCKTGPTLAKIEKVETSDNHLKDFNQFEIQ